MVRSPFDVVFISYNEPQADQNFASLLKLIPNAKRVDGVKGVARAWVTAAMLSETSHFFSVDGDLRLRTDFSWSIEDFQGASDRRVHVYRSLNAVNGLVYGYGSVHLFNTQMVRDFKNFDVLDFTLSVATDGFKIQPEVASTTFFNSSRLASWRSGFREAAKLASRSNAYIGTAPDPKSNRRLEVWCSVGRDSQFGIDCIWGARAGALFGFQSPNDIGNVGDFNWLEQEFQKVENLDPELEIKKLGNKLREYGLNCVDFSIHQSESIKRWLYNV